MNHQYENYSAEEFLEEPLFIRWIKERSEEDRMYWENWIASNPANLEEYKEAEVNLMAILAGNRIAADEKVKAEVWTKISAEITPAKGKVRRLLTGWAAAASVLLILISGFLYFYSNNTLEDFRKGKVSDNTTHQPDILPGGNKATLTLADGSTVILDSTHNGNITQQGNVTVIKLDDGQLAYNPTTHNAPPTTLIYNTITTPRGGQYQVVLADGSKVWLNAASSLTFPTSFPGKERDVKITGEAYFEVAHNAQKPFRVSVNDMTVEVLGTHFNINGYADEGVVKTTLLEGKVRVEAAGQSALLKPGQQARLEISNQQLETRNGVDLEEVMAWKNGLFYFNNADVQTVMRQLSRWYDMDIVYSGVIPERNFEGEMQRNLSLSQVLKLLGQNRINFEIVGRKLIVKP